MKKNKIILFFIAFILTLVAQAQLTDLSGQLIATDDVEGIHVLNKTSAKYTISKEDGSFVIPAKVSDTIFVSGLKYEAQEFIITKAIVDIGSFSVTLIEKINELNEVGVGKIFTGSLQSDLENLDAKTEINFYDLGIPGYTGKPLTLNERKLHDADAGSWGSVGLGFSVNFHKLLNTVSGRTKKLKEIVALDNEEKCISRLRREFEAVLFETDSLAQNLKNEYFYFCQEDDGFEALCQEQNDLKSIEFLKQKLKAYKVIRQSATKE